MVVTASQIEDAVLVLFGGGAGAREADAFLQEEVKKARCNEVVGPLVEVLRKRGNQEATLFAAQALHGSFRACVVKAQAKQRSHVSVEDGAWVETIRILFDLADEPWEAVVRRQVASALAACLLKAPTQASATLVADVAFRLGRAPASRVDVLAALPEEAANSSMRPEKRAEHHRAFVAAKGLALEAIATAVDGTSVDAMKAFEAATPWLSLCAPPSSAAADSDLTPEQRASGDRGTAAFATEAVGAFCAYPSQHQNVDLLEAASGALQAALQTAAALQNDDANVLGILVKVCDGERLQVAASTNRRAGELFADLDATVAATAARLRRTRHALAGLRGLVSAHAALVATGQFQQSNTLAPALAQAWRAISAFSFEGGGAHGGGKKVLTKRTTEPDDDDHMSREVASGIAALASEFALASTRERFVAPGGVSFASGPLETTTTQVYEEENDSDRDAAWLFSELAGDAVKDAYRAEYQSRLLCDGQGDHHQKKDHRETPSPVAAAVGAALAGGGLAACDRVRALAKVAHHEGSAATLVAGIAAATKQGSLSPAIASAVSSAATLLSRFRNEVVAAPETKEVVATLANFAVAVAEAGGRAGAVALMHLCVEAGKRGEENLVDACRPAVVRAHRLYFDTLVKVDVHQRQAERATLRPGQEPVATIVLRAVTAVASQGRDAAGLVDALADRFARSGCYDLDSAVDLCVALAAVGGPPRIFAFPNLERVAQLAGRALVDYKPKPEATTTTTRTTTKCAGGGLDSDSDSSEDDSEDSPEARLCLGPGVNVFFAMVCGKKWRDGKYLKGSDEALGDAAAACRPYLEGREQLGAVSRLAVEAAAAAGLTEPAAVLTLELVAVIDGARHATALSDAARVLVNADLSSFYRDERAAARVLAFLRRVPPDLGLRHLAAVVQSRRRLPALAAKRAVDLATHFLSASAQLPFETRVGFLTFLFAATALGLLPSATVSDAARACLTARSNTFQRDLRAALDPIADLLTLPSSATTTALTLPSSATTIALDDLARNLASTENAKADADNARAFKKLFKQVTGGKRKAGSADASLASSSKQHHHQQQQRGQKGAPSNKAPKEDRHHRPKRSNRRRGATR